MGRLNCLVGNCPSSGGMVDFRECRHCRFFDGQPSIGIVLCDHSDADPSDVSEERMESLRQAVSVGVAHVAYAGPTGGS